MTESFQPITFHWVDSAVLGLAVLVNIATTTNPSSARPPFWQRIGEDTPEGRQELARRIRLVAKHDDTSLHGTERWEHITAWAEKEGLTDGQ
jgi:hypothetical protein